MWDNIKNQANNFRQSLVTTFKEPFKNDQFLETGKINIEQFIQSGDRLIKSCPAWQWKSGMVENKYLPKDKQFLQISQVKSSKRISQIQQQLQDIDEDNIIIKQDLKNNKQDIIDVDLEFEELRYYNLQITYDFYYNTPRIYIQGFKDNGSILDMNQMYEDIMIQYAQKTVTMENQPHLNVRMLTLHPCKHAETILMMVQNMRYKNNNINYEHCLFIFLKFMNSVIPTIEYDISGDLYL